MEVVFFHYINKFLGKIITLGYILIKLLTPSDTLYIQ